jgi:hypothetical protein
MSNQSITGPKKLYALTAMAPVLGGGKAKFYLVSVRKTKTGRTTKWDSDVANAKTWAKRAAVEEFQFCHRYLKARIALVVRP